MAGITNAEFAMKLIPYGFDTVTIGGYNTDNESIDACEKIIARGRKEFNYPKEEIYEVIENEVNTIKDSFDGEPFKKKVKAGWININSYTSAVLWNGKPKEEANWH